MFDQVIEWGKKLKPPSGSSQGKDVTAWRWTVAITVGVTAVGLAAHIAIACGYMAFFHPGFARADEITKTRDMVQQVAQVTQSKIQQVDDQIKAQRVAALRVSILDLRQKQCGAPAGAVRTLYTQSLQDALDEYQELAAKMYQLPDCASF